MEIKIKKKIVFLLDSGFLFIFSKGGYSMQPDFLYSFFVACLYKYSTVFSFCVVFLWNFSMAC